ncbi:hypothetical protein [Ruminococcus sp.]|uniref:hypothetical protein n=1 Tax=Ruminococcus sp. TaxID=41978 RepID=UPI0025EA45E7|nr:hypothetical protein [Ruminococcus sp.]MCR4638429.1 hypothetical protein [Ruminococcus sp.]
MNRMIFASAAAMALMLSAGCASGRIHERSYLRAAAISRSGQLTFSFFNDDDTIIGVGDDIDSAKSSAELIGGKPVFTGYTELVIVDGEDSLELLDHMLESWRLSPSCTVVYSGSGEELLRDYDAEQLIGITEQAVKQGIAPECDIITVLGGLCRSGQAEVTEIRADGSAGSRIIF